MAHESESLLDELDGAFVEDFEVVRGVGSLPRSLSEPLNVVLNAIDVFHVFLFRVSVIESQVAFAVVIFGSTKVESDGLSVTNVQVTIRLRRESGENQVVELFVSFLQ